MAAPRAADPAAPRGRADDRPADAPAPTRTEARSWRRHLRRPAPPAAATASPPPVRLLAPSLPSPFAPGREIVFARVGGALLASLGVRHGDHVALDRTAHAEHGDLAAVVDLSGRAALWRVYPEGDALRLSTGDPAHSRRTGRNPRVQGVVVGVLRKFPT